MQWTLKQLESFVWVAKLGSFRRAAERLNTTQPNISVRISALEAALDQRLLDRDAGSVRLTINGQTLLGYAEQVLIATEEFSAQSGLSNRQPGLLRIGATEIVAQTWLRHLLRSLQEEFPNLDVELTVDLSVNLRAALVDRALDLGLLNGPISDFNITNLGLGDVPLAWLAAPVVAARLPDVSQMPTQPLLVPARNTRPFVEVAAHFRKTWRGVPRLVPSTNLSSSLQMAIDGLGVALMPPQMAVGAVKSGDLVTLPYPWNPSPLRFTASYAHTPANRVLERAAEMAAEIAATQDNFSL